MGLGHRDCPGGPGSGSWHVVLPPLHGNFEHGPAPGTEKDPHCAFAFAGSQPRLAQALHYCGRVSHSVGHVQLLLHSSSCLLAPGHRHARLLHGPCIRLPFFPRDSRCSTRRLAGPGCGARRRGSRLHKCGGSYSVPGRPRVGWGFHSGPNPPWCDPCRPRRPRRGIVQSLVLPRLWRSPPRSSGSVPWYPWPRQPLPAVGLRAFSHRGGRRSISSTWVSDRLAMDHSPCFRGAHLQLPGQLRCGEDLSVVCFGWHGSRHSPLPRLRLFPRRI
mmetsp:Transcript_3049/g.8769  ORF Transcript_3049/g.8769 Transcript_3049/m.8769 type:complete len:273 (+) Transcript_3049:148-966(+)